jgi:hypothetical protein
MMTSEAGQSTRNRIVVVVVAVVVAVAVVSEAKADGVADVEKKMKYIMSACSMA